MIEETSSKDGYTDYIGMDYASPGSDRTVVVVVGSGAPAMMGSHLAEKLGMQVVKIVDNPTPDPFEPKVADKPAKNVEGRSSGHSGSHEYTFNKTDGNWYCRLCKKAL
jgi:hypothetical protein